MSVIDINKSEKLLKAWCLKNEWECSKVPEASQRTPDYKLKIIKTVIYAEVKEIVTNEEERKSLETLENTGVGSSYGEEPGKTVREKIKESYGQIKPFAEKENTSAILVLYNNSNMPGLGRLDHYHVLTAMFGLQTVPVQLPTNPVKPLSFGCDYLGSKKSVTEERNTYLSGILTLYEHYENGLSAFFYHNPFCKFPISYQLLRNINCTQYRPDIKNLKWELESGV